MDFRSFGPSMSQVGRGSTDDRVVELAFAFDNPDYPFVGASAAEGCTVELEEMVPRSGGTYAEFFTVVDADPDRITDLAEDHESAEARLLDESETGSLFEFTVSANCPAVGLAELGALPRTVRAEDGEGEIVAELPGHYDVSRVTEAFLGEFAAELTAKRQKAELTPLFSHREFDQVVDERLTDRQREVLEFAFEEGYYDWPRESTGEELAAELDISPPTLSKHLYVAERKVLSVLFQA